MRVARRTTISSLITTLLLISVTLVLVQPAVGQRTRRARSSPRAVLWRDPGNIQMRNLLQGPGAEELAPAPPFKFIKEGKKGESPKFDVEDARNVVWTVKLGEEAQAETVATRLVWAVGYFAEESYYFDEVQIENLPKLKRGREFVLSEGVVTGARFEPERKHLTEGPVWDWDENAFSGTRQLNGLKVLMILLNNFDARKDNNKIYYTRSPQGERYEARHYVTDLGATLGRSGGLGGKRTKNNLEDFLSTRFVMGVEDDMVQFDYDTRPTKLGHLSVLYYPYYRGEVKKEKSMRRIPVAHARWIGSLLSQLSDEQLRDAFRAARYNDATMEEYVGALRERISQLTRL